MVEQNDRSTTSNLKTEETIQKYTISETTSKTPLKKCYQKETTLLV